MLKLDAYIWNGLQFQESEITWEETMKVLRIAIITQWVSFQSLYYW